MAGRRLRRADRRARARPGMVRIGRSSFGSSGTLPVRFCPLGDAASLVHEGVGVTVGDPQRHAVSHPER